MALSAGTRLGPYEITSFVAAGGMGEVYRARDTRLDRTVAIKVLPASFASDPDRLRRFEQEARAVAALNHSNILALHDIGTHEGTSYLVSEFLDGNTLREQLANGALPSRKAIEYALQIAQGLGAAHDKGIVHRDLKPENIFVTRDGRLKILDFGLAKAQTQAVAPDGSTVASQTTPGVAMGTAGYMSPEQVRGENIDHRSDIFSFGAVLYEMLAGQRAFQRNSSVETMNAILKEEPREIAPPERGIPPVLQRIVHRCLEKERDQRFQSAKDLSFALDSINAGASTSQTQAVAGKVRRWNVWRTATLVMAVMLVAAFFAWMRSRLSSPEPPKYERITFRKGAISAARFAPDNQTVIYNAAWDKPTFKLYRSRVDATDARGLDLAAAGLLAVSHSGELAITSNLNTSRLARVSIDGGAPRELLDNVIAADWSPDGTQLAVARCERGKCRLEYPIGKPLYETIDWISHMRVSPQGDAIAFMDHPISGDDRGTVMIVDLKGNQRRLTPEWEGEQGLGWSPDGREVWFTATATYDWSRALYAVTRSGKQRLVLRAPAALYLEDIASDGRVLLRHEERRYEVAVGQIGGESRLLSWLEIMVAESASRDGKYAVIGDYSGSGGTDYKVYLAKLEGSPAVQVGGGVASGISPDNKWVTSILPSDTTKVLLLPTGIGETKIIATPNFHYRGANWTSDGNRLVVRASESDRPARFWVQDIAGGLPHPVTPEGVYGRFVTVNHSDYICVHDPTGAIRLYPIDGGEPKPMAGVSDTDEVVAGSIDSDDVYVSSDPSAIPQQIVKVNLATGRRQPFLVVSPVDPAGIVNMSSPLFSGDEKRYVFNQVRELSVLYVATGLK